MQVPDRRAERERSNLQRLSRLTPVEWRGEIVLLGHEADVTWGGVTPSLSVHVVQEDRACHPE